MVPTTCCGLYMTHRILFAKGVWSMVSGAEIMVELLLRVELLLQGGLDSYFWRICDSYSTAASSALPTTEQDKRDGKDANAHTLIALSVRHPCQTLRH